MSKSRFYLKRVKPSVRECHQDIRGKELHVQKEHIREEELTHTLNIERKLVILCRSNTLQ